MAQHVASNFHAYGQIWYYKHLLTRCAAVHLDLQVQFLRICN